MEPLISSEVQPFVAVNECTLAISQIDLNRVWAEYPDLQTHDMDQQAGNTVETAYTLTQMWLSLSKYIIHLQVKKFEIIIKATLDTRKQMDTC